MDEYNEYSASADENEKYKIGFAVTSFVLGLLGLLCCVCGLGYVLAPLSLIFGIISLAKHRGGKGLAVTGLILSGITIAFLVYSQIAYGEISRDMAQFAKNDTYYIEQYEKTHEIPQEFMKYKDPKYDKQWQELGMENFDQFYAFFITWYKQTIMEMGAASGSGSSNSSIGEKPVDICIRKVPVRALCCGV